MCRKSTTYSRRGCTMRTAIDAPTATRRICWTCWNRSMARTFDSSIWNRACRASRWRSFASCASTLNRGWVAGTTRLSSFKTGWRRAHVNVVIKRSWCARFVYFRESFQRVGTSVAAYLQYQKICSTNLAPYSIRSSSDPSRNIQDLDEYSMQKFLDDMVGPITEPAFKRLVFIHIRPPAVAIFYRFLLSSLRSLRNRRYLEYFIGLLSGDIKLNSLPLYLRFIKMESPPCMHHKISYHENEWSSFIKIFEGERFVFISGKRIDRLDIFVELFVG